MAIVNKICATCKRNYSYCNSCPSDDKNPSYMNMFCSKSCKNLFMIATDFAAGEATKEQAKNIISKSDLSRQQYFKDSIKNFIKGIVSEGEKKENPSVKTINVKQNNDQKTNNKTTDNKSVK